MKTEQKKVTPADSPTGEFFFQALRNISDGDLLSQLDEGTATLVSQVLETGGKGTLVLKLKVSKTGKERQVKITPEVKIDAPNYEIRERILYASETGLLSKSDPAQGELDFGDTPRRVAYHEEPA